MVPIWIPNGRGWEDLQFGEARDKGLAHFGQEGAGKELTYKFHSCIHSEISPALE